MAKVNFTVDCSILIKAIIRAQGELFCLMFDELDTDFESELWIFGISVQEDED